MSANLSENFDLQKILDISNKYYSDSIPDGTPEYEKNKLLYNYMKDIKPELPAYEEIAPPPLEPYNPNPESIDTSSQNVNHLYDVMEDITLQQTELINKNSTEINQEPRLELGRVGDPLGELTASKTKKVGSFLEGLVDTNNYVYDLFPGLKKYDGIRESIKQGLNQTLPAKQYEIQTGKSLYEVDDSKYNDTFMEDVAASIASFSDPASVLSFFTGYGLAGRFTTYGFRGLKNLSSKIPNWIAKARYGHVVKTIPKTKSNPTLQKKLFDYLQGEGAERLAFGTGGFAGTGFALGAINSTADQRMKRGKYQNGDGSIKTWDTLIDSWKSGRDMAATGLLTTGIGQAMGVGHIWANAKWRMGQKNLATFTSRALTSEPAKLGVQGLIYQTMPMALDKDIRAMYYDDKGDFDYKKFAVDTMAKYPSMALMWGINKAFIPKTQYKYRNDPNWHKSKNATIEGLPAPRDINFPKALNNMRRSIVQDIKYQNNKLIDKNFGTTETKLMNKSMANVKADLGINTPFEFFDKDINTQTSLIETIDGLKDVSTILNNTIKILDKAGVKNKDGDFTKIEMNKLSDDDIAYLTYVTPLGYNGYQGYRSQQIETKNGRDEYIQRYEKENNVKLSEQQREVVLLAQQKTIDKFDMIKQDMAQSLLQGYGKNEVEKQDVKSELHRPTEDVIILEAGKPMNNEVITIDKESAQQGIDAGELKSASVAKSEGIDIVEKPNNSIAEQVVSLLTDIQTDIKGIKTEQQRQKELLPYSDDIPVNKQSYDTLIKNVKKDDLNKYVNKKSVTSNIKDKYDIAILKDTFTPEVLGKRLLDVNRMLKHSGRKSITKITNKDVENYFEWLKKQPQVKTGQISPNTTTNVNEIFKGLLENKYINKNPLKSKYIKQLTADYNLALKTQKLQQILPEPKEFYSKVPQIKSLMKKDKTFNLGLDLIANYAPIRAEEISALKGRHIAIDSKNNKYYIDLLKPRKEGGAAKARGRKRIITLPKDKAMQLIKLSKPNELIFPQFAQKLTTASKQVFPDGFVKSKAFKEIEKIFINSLELTGPEKSQMLLIAGHGTKEAIDDYYTQRENWGDIHKAQEKLLTKIAVEKQKLLQESPIEKGVTQVVQKISKGAKKLGLSIEDIGNKPDKTVVKNFVNKASKEDITLNDEVKGKLLKSVKNLWNNLTSDMGSVESKGLMEFYANSVGIENPSEFKLNKNVTSADLAQFASMVVDLKNITASNKKDLAKKYRNITTAENILLDNNIGDKQYKTLIKNLFYSSDKSLEDINPLDLTFEQTKELIRFIDDNPAIKKDVEPFLKAKNSLDIDKLSEMSNKFFGEGLEKFSKITAMQTNLYGQQPTVIRMIADKIKKPELKKLASDLENHQVLDVSEGARLKKFEQEVYIMLYDKALRENRPILRRMVTQPTTLIRPKKRAVQYGKILFDKEIKDNIKYLDVQAYNGLKEFVKNNPKDKVGAARLKNATKFFNKVYDVKKMEGTNKVIYRIDTVESKIGKSWKEYTTSNMNSIKLALKSNMNDAQYQSMETKKILKFIEESFYVPRVLTTEFKKEVDLLNLNLQNRLDKQANIYAIEMASEKYKTSKLTKEQIDEFKDDGIVEAYMDWTFEQKFGGSRVNPRTLLRRKVYLGERIKTKLGKFIDVYEYKYDNYIPNYAASTAKLIPNLQYFPYLVNIPNLKFKTNLPSVIAKLNIEGGEFGKFIQTAIQVRTGLRPDRNTDTSLDYLQSAMNTLGRANRYLVRANLSGATSPLKNALIGVTANSLAYDLPKVLYYTALATDFRKRLEAQQTGMLGISYVSINEAENNFVAEVLEKLFTTMRFPTTEGIARTSSIFLALDELPLLVAQAKKGNAAAINRLKTRYQLSDTKEKDGFSEIDLFKKYGFSDYDIDWSKPEFSIKEKGVFAKRFKNVDGNDVSVKDRALLQKRLDRIKLKIMLASHQNTQGTVDPLYQPQIMGKLLKPFAVYAQTAISASHNIYNGFRENNKNGNYHRNFQFLALGAILGQALLNYRHEILGAADPGELDTAWVKKNLRRFNAIEAAGVHSWMLGWVVGQDPLSNPYLPAPAISQGKLATEFVFEMYKSLVEAPELPKEIKKGTWKYYLYKNYKPPVDDFAKAIVGVYRDYRRVNLNANSPYYKIQQQIESNERTFRDEMKPLSKPTVIINHINSRDYRHIKESFEQSENFNLMNQAVVSAWWNKFEDAIANNEKPESAKKLATRAVKSKLTALNPILNGQGSKKEGKWFSTRMEYFLYLKEKAVKQGKDENNITEQEMVYIISGKRNKRRDEIIMNKLKSSPYVKRALQQELQYKIKMKKWEKQWQYWLRNNYKKDEYLKTWSKLRPTSWEELGLAPK